MGHAGGIVSRATFTWTANELEGLLAIEAPDGQLRDALTKLDDVIATIRGYGTIMKEARFDDTTLLIKIPKVQPRKYNGDISVWLGSWAQFKNIYEITVLTTADKLQFTM